MSAAPAIVHDEEQQWLLEGREIVTASEAAAIIGADERRGALAVWASKTGGVETIETLPMRRGRRLEAIIVEEYGEQTGRPVEPWPRFKRLRHPTVPFIGATLDATTLLGAITIPLEAKSALGSAREWGDEPPLGYQCQAQLQSQCFGSPAAAIAGLVGPGPLKTYDLDRDDAFFAALLPLLERFMWHVRNHIPPEADGLPGTTAAIRRLWSTADGQTIPLDREALTLTEEWEAAQARGAAAAATAQELENKLRRLLGSASFGALADGTYLALQVTNVRGYTKTVKPTSYRRLRRFRPRLRRRG